MKCRHKWKTYAKIDEDIWQDCGKCGNTKIIDGRRKLITYYKVMGILPYRVRKIKNGNIKKIMCNI